MSSSTSRRPDGSWPETSALNQEMRRARLRLSSRAPPYFYGLVSVLIDGVFVIVRVEFSTEGGTRQHSTGFSIALSAYRDPANGGLSTTGFPPVVPEEDRYPGPVTSGPVVAGWIRLPLQPHAVSHRAPLTASAARWSESHQHFQELSAPPQPRRPPTFPVSPPPRRTSRSASVPS